MRGDPEAALPDMARSTAWQPPAAVTLPWPSRVDAASRRKWTPASWMGRALPPLCRSMARSTSSAAPAARSPSSCCACSSHRRRHPASAMSLPSYLDIAAMTLMRGALGIARSASSSCRLLAAASCVSPAACKHARRGRSTAPEGENRSCAASTIRSHRLAGPPPPPLASAECPAVPPQLAASGRLSPPPRLASPRAFALPSQPAPDAPRSTGAPRRDCSSEAWSAGALSKGRCRPAGMAAGRRLIAALTLRDGSGRRPE
mmetsp:Transcript_64580/g.171666  ORF Transcript_64580/g.171666 Transcript_64580/m.171666 type:complete len:260 (+) Transcript_64580:557-1336(+)